MKSKMLKLSQLHDTLSEGDEELNEKNDDYEKYYISTPFFLKEPQYGNWEKLKESLLTRRKDRVDPNQYKGFSIVDLAVAFDMDRRMLLEEKAKKLRAESQRILDSREGYIGNKGDRDAKGSAREDGEEDED